MLMILPVIAGSQQMEVNPPANGYFEVFSETTLTDVDDDGQALLDVELLLVKHENGTLIDPNGAMTLLDQTYKVSGLSPAQMTVVLRGLRFTPTPNGRPSPEETRFILKVSDRDGGAVEDDQALITVYHNVAPEALADSYTVTEDDPAMLDVLANDTDVNEENVLVIIDLAGADGGGAGDIIDLAGADGGGLSDAQIKSSGAGADVYIDPSSNGTALTPHKGTQLRYDPRFSSILEALPLGGRVRTTTFEYTIVDLEEEAGDPRSYGDGIADTRPSTVQVKCKGCWSQ